MSCTFIVGLTQCGNLVVPFIVCTWSQPSSSISPKLVSWLHILLLVQAIRIGEDEYKKKKIRRLFSSNMSRMFTLKIFIHVQLEPRQQIGCTLYLFLMQMVISTSSTRTAKTTPAAIPAISLCPEMKHSINEDKKIKNKIISNFI